MRILRIFCLIILTAALLPATARAADVYKVGDKNWKVTIVQQKLPLLGIGVDRQDGLLSKETSGALKVFQAKYKKIYKLKATGRLDDATYQAVVAAAYDKTAPRADREAIIKTAAGYRGAPYKFGGVNTKGFDCSGYVQFVFNRHKVALPRTADVQYKEGIFVTRKNLRKGDLVFFTTYEKGPSHVGIYDSGGKFWHVSSSKGVMRSGLDDYYWKDRYIGARRILAA